ncbi:MAG TPA: hypothetical protein VM512_00030 [Burkholderiaceae bacterium]|nr:hypothetical protein [Burkholderiaceae bacterium]
MKRITLSAHPYSSTQTEGVVDDSSHRPVEKKQDHETSTEETPQQVVPNAANLTWPESVFTLIGSFLLPPPQPESPDANAVKHWHQQVRDSAVECQQASRLDKHWHTNMCKTMQALGPIVVKVWLEEQAPHSWRSAPHGPLQYIRLTAPPSVFERVKNFADAAARMEGLLLKTSQRPRLFLRVFQVLLEQVFLLAKHEGLSQDQRERLLAFPLIALAILYPRGLVLDAQLFKDMARLLLRHSAEIPDELRWRLFKDLQTVRYRHFLQQLPELGVEIDNEYNKLPPRIQRWEAPHEQINDRWDAPKNETHIAHLDEFMRPSPVGPYGLEVLNWICRNFALVKGKKDPLSTLFTRISNEDVSARLAQHVIQTLEDAAEGSGEEGRAARAVLLDLFPLHLLRKAFPRLSDESQKAWKKDLQ